MFAAAASRARCTIRSTHRDVAHWKLFGWSSAALRDPCRASGAGIRRWRRESTAPASNGVLRDRATGRRRSESRDRSARARGRTAGWWQRAADRPTDGALAARRAAASARRPRSRSRGDGDALPARRRHYVVGRCLDRGQGRPDRAMEARAGRGQAQLAPMPLEQGDAEILCQPLDLVGDRRFGEAKLGRRRPQPPRVRRFGGGEERFQRRKGRELQANSLISSADFAQIEGIAETDFMVQQ